jgi:NAD(P)-dependent dehydrogenase (short-subunit alcohol dehydrogenase family)
MGGRVEGKVAIVTGAGTSAPGVGTGKAISVTLAREGASVLLVDMFPERAEETLGLIEEVGGTGHVFKADITRSPECETMVRAAVERFGGVDILVNNAAITRHVSILETTDELYESVVGVNLRGAFMSSKYAIPEIVKRGGGSIVNIGSVAGIRDSGSSHPAYASSKAGLLGLTVDLAGEYGRSNVRVNAVLPGMILTPMAQSVNARGAGSANLTGVNFLGRRGDAWDIANAVLFLCSDEAAYITGVTMPVDGGATMGMPATHALRGGAPGA